MLCTLVCTCVCVSDVYACMLTHACVPLKRPVRVEQARGSFILLKQVCHTCLTHTHTHTHTDTHTDTHTHSHTNTNTHMHTHSHTHTHTPVLQFTGGSPPDPHHHDHSHQQTLLSPMLMSPTPVYLSEALIRSRMKVSVSV